MNASGKGLRLSARLDSIAGLVTEGNRIADIGTDHAYLPIYLCMEEKIPSAIASDLREGPLAIARVNIRNAGLEDRIELRLSDGLDAYSPGEAETLVLAGMGGRLICRILGNGREILHGFHEILLQPQSEIAAVRTFLADEDLEIVQEACTEEDGKYYPVIRAVPPEDGKPVRYGQEEAAFGPCLLARKDPVLKRYLENRRVTVEEILEDLRGRKGTAVSDRIYELKEEKRMIQSALQRYEM